jgi:hypothetical protein
MKKLHLHSSSGSIVAAIKIKVKQNEYSHDLYILEVSHPLSDAYR